MPRAPRIVIPGVAHHVTQRGNRQQALFSSDSDRRDYIRILADALKRSGTRCLAWCLMDNHVHLMLVPDRLDGLRAPLSSVHTKYAQRVNFRQGSSGHLFQGRFASYPMDDRHMMFAVRYIECNPVKAGIVATAEEWRWLSARAHIDCLDDGLTDWRELRQYVSNWRAMLADGLDASDAVESALRSGQAVGNLRDLRPLGTVPKGTVPV
ncbi:MAG: transposase [Sphingorhabdus sp.]|uniref:transposase n=1 Tax=Sphingorhabdus sp. TaxID=1902408 RepID=UPI0038FD0E1D